MYDSYKTGVRNRQESGKIALCPGGEMAYTIGLGPIARKGVEVQLLSWAPLAESFNSGIMGLKLQRVI